MQIHWAYFATVQLHCATKHTLLSPGNLSSEFSNKMQIDSRVRKGCVHKRLKGNNNLMLLLLLLLLLFLLLLLPAAAAVVSLNFAKHQLGRSET